jgi:hypothetical protein
VSESNEAANNPGLTAKEIYDRVWAVGRSEDGDLARTIDLLVTGVAQAIEANNVKLVEAMAALLSKASANGSK